MRGSNSPFEERSQTKTSPRSSLSSGTDSSMVGLSVGEAVGEDVLARLATLPALEVWRDRWLNFWREC